MKTLAITIITALLVLAGNTAFALTQIGTVDALVGEAEAQNEKGETRSLLADQPVYLNDRVTTDPGAHLSIKFEDGTTIDQGENSSMTIDEYIYSPKNKEENASHVRLFKGVFKVVTDQITKLNPDRFKVSTEDGVIGIRGCAVGFDLTGPEEKVFVIDIHDVESVEILLKNMPLDPNAVQQLVIGDGGQGVILSKTGGLTVFQFNPADVNAILDLFALIYDTPRIPPPETSTTQIDRGRDEVVPEEVEQVVQQLVHDFDPKEPPKEPNRPAPTGNGPRRPGSSDPDTVIERSRQTLLSGRGYESDWSWGIWEETATATFPNGMQQVNTFHGTRIGGSFLSATEFTALKNDLYSYYLYGYGDAGAIALKGAMATLMSGSVSMGVQLGNGVAHWDGYFNLSGPRGSALNFDVPSGTFSPGGVMAGAVGGYSLKLDGTDQGRFTGSGINGRLVKGAGGAAVLTDGPLLANRDGSGGAGIVYVNGAVLEFRFAHEDKGVVVKGAAGADLYDGGY